MALPLSTVFTSERLIYEPLDSADEETKAFLYRQLTLDPEINGMGSINIFSPPAKSRYFETLTHWKDNLLSVVICLKPDNWDKISKDYTRAEHEQSLRGVPIGVVGLSPVHGMHQHHRSTRLGISIASKHQGKGYGSEALRWLANRAFDYANMHALRLQTGSINVKAINVYKNLGFVEDGRDRESLFMAGQWFDTVSMSILEHEWRAKRDIEQKTA